MKIEGVPFTDIDWRAVPATVHPGERGCASWRTRELGNVRVRLVDYTPGYVADHWCERGHVVHVLDGELRTELSDGRLVTLAAGSAYVVSDGAPHRSVSPAGARLLIVD
jgi:quercetin dioxygenase-like cupin family protein